MRVEMTAQEVAQKLQVDRQEVYGLLSFMEKQGMIRACGTKKAEGAKGKGATVYELDDSILGRMQETLAKIFG